MCIQIGLGCGRGDLQQTRGRVDIDLAARAGQRACAQACAGRYIQHRAFGSSHGHGTQSIGGELTACRQGAQIGGSFAVGLQACRGGAGGDGHVGARLQQCSGRCEATHCQSTGDRLHVKIGLRYGRGDLQKACNRVHIDVGARAGQTAGVDASACRNIHHARRLHAAQHDRAAGIDNGIACCGVDRGDVQITGRGLELDTCCSRNGLRLQQTLCAGGCNISCRTNQTC